jgi:ABC-type antimicrobial peptide transport system permease subunit
MNLLELLQHFLLSPVLYQTAASMFINYLKVAFRNLWKNKGFSFINILGLAIGMASAILILLWIQNEVSYDDFHERKDRIYEVWNRAEFSGELHCWSSTPKVLAAAMQRDFPEVEHVTRVDWGDRMLFSVGDKRLMIRGNIVDSSFLQIFSFPLLQGNAKTALMDGYSIVVTQAMARKLFGTEDAMGKVVRIDNKDNYTVTGVLKELPNNTRFGFEFLVPWAHLRRTGGDDPWWGNNSTQTFALLKSNSSLASIEPKMKVIKTRYDSTEKHWEMFLYPMSRWRLHSNFKGAAEDGGRIVFVRLFGIIAGFILLIACINFMNLSTARSEKRAKEVGIRKVVGAPRSKLITQFIGESVLLSFLAALLAIGIVLVSLGGFNTLTEKHLYVPYGSVWFWVLAIIFILFTGLLAGSYPAFFLSSFQPVKVLKGTFRAANALISPRKVLVVLQFTFAIILIICTIVVAQQINYARDREVGYDRANMAYHFLTGDLSKNYGAVKQELLSSGVATAVCRTNSPWTQRYSDTWGYLWEGKDPNDKTDFIQEIADEGVVATTGIKLVEGRDLDLVHYPNDSLALLLNESAVKAMHFKNPIGQTVKNGDDAFHVVGVIRDFIIESPYTPIRPMVIMGAKWHWFEVMNMRLNTHNSTEANLKKMEAILRRYNPQYPFEYHFVDEEYSKKFDETRRVGTLAGLFAALTIFISCLGLFGLATYMAENRVKEIGIRKVLGASVTGITTLLSKEFLILVGLSFFAAAPIAWFAMYKWLQDYPYRVPIQWWVFALAAALSLGIALVTVSFQAIRAGLRNPALSLRSE